MKNTTPDSEIIKTAVRQRYGALASGEPPAAASTCCASSSASAENASCGCDTAAQARTVGYSAADLANTPEGSNLGLGCGNPVALASLRAGQTILDLGSGAGFDAFLAMRAVGPTGLVIGVDMTPEMLTKARANTKKGGYPNVEFRLGEIEALPVADATIDVIISNCVINLCPDKRPVYREAFRVLKPGGRIGLSDVVARAELADDVKRDLALHCSCLAGATPEGELKTILEESGFVRISIRQKGNSDEIITSWEAKHGFESKVYAAEVTAVKPEGACGGSNSGKEQHSHAIFP
jgi:ubiquinone/menaquinone biosynthesis C-methylase UbiE